MKLSRRDALKTISALLSAAALPACASVDEAATPETGATEDELAFCFGKKPPPGRGALRKYDKIVVLMMENRSFDHYFGHLSMPRELGGEGRTDVDGLRGTESNPGLEGPVTVHHADNYALGDVVHEWDPCRVQHNNGRNDGFVKAQLEDLAGRRFCVEPVDTVQGGRCGEAKDAMAFYKRADTPVYHQLMDQYALCDRWFSSILGPTWPNRYYMHCGTAFGAKGGELRDIRAFPTTRTIFEALGKKCVGATNFFADFPWALKPLGRVRNLAPLAEDTLRRHLRRARRSTITSRRRPRSTTTPSSVSSASAFQRCWSVPTSRRGSSRRPTTTPRSSAPSRTASSSIPSTHASRARTTSPARSTRTSSRARPPSPATSVP